MRSTKKWQIGKSGKGKFLALGLFTALVVLGCVATLGSTWFCDMAQSLSTSRDDKVGEKSRTDVSSPQLHQNKSENDKTRFFLRHSIFNCSLNVDYLPWLKLGRCISKATSVLYHIQCPICSARSLLKKRLAIHKDFFAKCHI